MKLNMGCGVNRREGWVNVDKEAACNPDLLLDVERFPWPLDDDSVDEMLFHHSLEHMGQSSSLFLDIMQEIYRVCSHGATLQVNVPHPRHDHFLGDPTHVRAITPDLFALFSKKNNESWRHMGAANTPLALYLDVDFELRQVTQVIEQDYLRRLESGEITEMTLQQLIRERNNIVSEFRITLTVIKQAGANPGT